MEGWIKLHRKIKSHWIWENANYLKWWLDILLLANHAPQKILLNGQVVEIAVGEHHTSILKLSQSWQADRKTVDRFLHLLREDGMIVINKSRQNGTTIKVANYLTYQRQTAEDENNEPDNALDIPRGNGLDINKNEKNEKKKKKKQGIAGKPLCSFFEEAWQLYPNKAGKQAVGAKAKKEMEGYGLDVIKACIASYERTKPHWQSYMNGSTFFNGRWKEFLEPAGYAPAGDVSQGDVSQSHAQVKPEALDDYNRPSY